MKVEVGNNGRRNRKANMKGEKKTKAKETSNHYLFIGNC
jgi:hypothetical protein